MSKFDSFNITDATYKTVQNQNIDLSILTPKNLPAGKYPLMNAILITPDYRLLPEARGVDILSDITDLWRWVTTELPFVLSSLSLQADLQSVLAIGESAGGYLAVQSGLLHTSSSPKLRIKAVISQYGVLDIKTRFFMEGYEKIMMGAPMMPKEMLEEHVAGVKKNGPTVVTAADPSARMQLLAAVVQHGQFVEVLGRESELYPMENLEHVREGQLPAIWLFDGKQDTVVPFESSVSFAEKLQKLHPDAKYSLTLTDGEHLFDAMADLDTPWLKLGLEWVEQCWP